MLVWCLFGACLDSNLFQAIAAEKELAIKVTKIEQMLVELDIMHRDLKTGEFIALLSSSPVSNLLHRIYACHLLDSSFQAICKHFPAFACLF